MTPPVLVIAVGNRSRGDDALGPCLLDALRETGPDAAQVELIEEFQLQVEQALDLVGRRAVLFVDASRAPVEGGVALTPLAPQAGHPPASHTLAPAAVLGVYAQVQREPPPPAWLLAIEGSAFGLGEGLSAAAARRLAQAQALALRWLAQFSPPAPAAATARPDPAAGGVR
ncbi:MAG: hydrogenase maturation protease [Piscinibacter sp.]|nr:hydrogenase maturation protease [Piscinibacter sp.]